MLLMSIFQSVEFYVIAVVVAAAVVAVFARRPSDGPVRQFTLDGVLAIGSDSSQAPSIEFRCADDGTVLIRRHGLRGVYDNGKVTLHVEVKGFDIKLVEHISPGNEPWSAVDTASFILDFMGREHYFISYLTETSSSDSSMFVSVTLKNRPGNVVRKNLV